MHGEKKCMCEKFMLDKKRPIQGRQNVDGKPLAPGRENGHGLARRKVLLWRPMREVGKLLLMVIATAISVAAILFAMNLLGYQPPRP
jgi:hypothetical protein